ncbi:hypothetical protein [Micromonospora sp. DT63]|uniref:hypothetical protein n=1 Tax=Micromonospora sp. DT63 TaxID=3393441 RepID=UPI003CF2A220
MKDLTAGLRREVLTTDVASAEWDTAADAPAGAKSGMVVAAGALAVTLAPIVVESLMGIIASWLSRQPADVEIEIDGRRFKGRVSKAQRDELVAAYLNRMNSGS